MHPRRNWEKASATSASVRASNSVASNGSDSGSLIYEGNEEYYNGDKIVRCHCLEQCRVVTAWTESNPSRRFHGCKNYGNPGGCKFFLWYDPPIPQKMKSVMASLLKDLRNAEKENVTLKIEITKLKKKVKLLLLACVICCILVVVVLGVNPRKKQGLQGLKMLN